MLPLPAKLLSTTLLLLLAQGAVAEDWPQFGRDRTRNAVSPEKGAPLWWQVEERDQNGKLVKPARNILWSAPLGNVTYGDPVVYEGKIWIGTNNYHPPAKSMDASVLACLDEKTGRVLYRYLSPRLDNRSQDTPFASLACSPYIEGKRMWFTTNRSEVVCLTLEPLAAGGEPRVVWNVDMRRKLGVVPYSHGMLTYRLCSIACHGNLIFVITGNGVDWETGKLRAPEAPSLVCFNKNTGKVVWTDNSPGKNILEGQWASPLVIEVSGKAQVLAPQGDGWLRAFDCETGKLIWQFDTNPKDATRSRFAGRNTRHYLLATPVLYEGRIYIGNGQHPIDGSGPAWLYCIDPTQTGDISPELADGPGKGKPNPNSGMVWKFGGRDNKTRPHRFGSTVSNVAIHQGLVAATEVDGYVHCLDARTGQEYWCYDTLANIVASPLIVDGKVYVGTEEDVSVLALAKRRMVFERIDMPGGVQCSPIFANGVLYIATRNRLYAIAGHDQAAIAESSWPQWRGPDRNNIARDTGLLTSWPKDGPPLAWKAEGLGLGARSIAVAGGRICTLGHRDDKELLLVLDENNGKTLRQWALGPAVKELPGMQWLSQRTPTIDRDRVYALSAQGILVCADLNRGEILWQHDYAKDFGGAAGPWGYCDYLLVDGDKVICTPGGERATLVALDKWTGEVQWQCPVPGEKRGTHAPVVAATISGPRMYIQQLLKGTVGVAADNGQLLWHYPGTADIRGNVHAALVKGDLVLCSNGWGGSAALVKLVPDKGKFALDIQYQTRLPLDPWLGSSVLVDDQIHTSCGARIDFKTGKGVERLREGRFRGTMIFADGHLYHRTPDNKMLLTQVTSKGYVRKGEFQPPRFSKAPPWSFPVIAGGKLYLRDQDVLLCYDIRARKDRPRVPDAIFVPTPQDVVEKMLELAEVKKSDLVYDLGCGDGRIIVTAAKEYGCRAIGLDLDADCVKLSRDLAKQEKVGALVTVEHKDLFTQDLSRADVVTLYLLPKLNIKFSRNCTSSRPAPASYRINSRSPASARTAWSAIFPVMMVLNTLYTSGRPP